MRERPILFSAEMVRAILDRRKTETRRVMKPQPVIVEHTDEGSHVEWSCGRWPRLQVDDLSDLPSYGPYGIPGDRLWVRETWNVMRWIKAEEERTGLQIVKYRADGNQLFKRYTIPAMWQEMYAKRWRPSIHMPRWASRITLEVTEVRVQRLEEISDADAVEEGCPAGVLEFQELWDSINAKRGYSWESNPWVWVVTFKPIQKGGDNA